MECTLSSTEVASRQQCLDELDGYIDQCQTDISAMLEELEWTPDHFVQHRTRVACPHNGGHMMPASSVAKHSPSCELACQGCIKQEVEEILEDTSYAYDGSSCVYTETIDLQKLNAVLWNYHKKNNSVFYGYRAMPLTPEREEQMLSREDRLGMADFIVNKAREAKKLQELGQDPMLMADLADLVKKEDEVRQLDHIEELAALRDYKRRRQTYRAKNVHVTKKSHTEIMREVITNQMEMYTRSLVDEGLVEPPQHGSSRDGDVRAHQSSRDNPGNRDSPHIRDNGDRKHQSDRVERSHSRRSSPSRDGRDRDRSHAKRERSERSGSRDKRDRGDEVSDSRRGSKERSRSPSRKRRSRSRDRRKRRDRSRSRSASKSKLGKHKHKKHKKHKHRHRERMTEQETETKGEGEQETEIEDQTAAAETDSRSVDNVKSETMEM